MIRHAVEELLRFVIATEDIEFDTKTVPKGSTVELGIGAANHDPREFAMPETLDFKRPKFHSLAFGYGPHSCLSAQSQP